MKNMQTLFRERGRHVLAQLSNMHISFTAYFPVACLVQTEVFGVARGRRMAEQSPSTWAHDMPDHQHVVHMALNFSPPSLDKPNQAEIYHESMRDIAVHDTEHFILSGNLHEHHNALQYEEAKSTTRLWFVPVAYTASNGKSPQSKRKHTVENSHQSQQRS